MSSRVIWRTGVIAVGFVVAVAAGCGSGDVRQPDTAVKSDALLIGGYNIDGTIPDSASFSFVDDPEGNSKELGPLNSNTTKVGVIHSDAPPTLGDTNPNGQVDLRGAWADTNTVGGDVWLYFAWERDSSNGSGFIAWEFQQAAAPAECDYSGTKADLIASCNPWANRQPGDFLLVWDQQGNSKDIILRTFTDPDGGSFNSGDPLVLDAGVTLNSSVSAAEYSADGFKGEAAVNLSETVFTPGTCFSIANIIPGTITGNSDSADYKDTILGDFGITISNCGAVKVIKTDDATPPALLDGATFDLVTDADPSYPAQTSPGAEDTDVVASCTTVGGECTFTNILQGQYWVIETAAPPLHDMASPNYQPVTVAADGTSEVTFVNPRQPGAIKITKTRKHAADGSGDHPQSGVDFTINGTTVTTDADGVACLDDLPFGDYTVHEDPKDGYEVQDDVTVTVDNTATCDADPYEGESVSFHNTPLSDLTCSFSSQVTGGTLSKIDCTGPGLVDSDATPDAYDDDSDTYTDLLPGTYVCTIVIDP